MVEALSIADRDDVRELVREKYGAAAMTVLNGEGAACCGGVGNGGKSSCCGGDVITGALYSDVEATQIPEAALLASLGCGNPTALAALNPGEVVLDLGSGGGIDVLLSAKRVGPSGFAYGLDMTDEMLALAERNKAEAEASNVAFLKGHIESIPLANNSVDVIISNCVINLSSDKNKVLSEAFRVLKPGGRFAVSDVVTEGDLPDAVRADMESYVGCVAGALDRSDYIERLTNAGFIEANIEATRRYMFADLEATACAADAIRALTESEKADLDGRIMGAFIRAVKPQSGTCCGPSCCTTSD
jgi:ubiquinone/menaquinone biosynthesis C-methylase UbiE